GNARRGPGESRAQRGQRLGRRDPPDGPDPDTPRPMSPIGTIAVPGVPGLARPSLTTRTRATAGEGVVCGLGLGVLALLMCGVHIRDGGFYYDDWGVLALGRFPLPGGLLHGLWLDYGQRPGQVLYYAALDEAVGPHAALWLALAAGM